VAMPGSKYWTRKTELIVVTVFALVPFLTLIVHFLVYLFTGYRDNATDYVMIIWTIATNIAFLVLSLTSGSH
jgi:hypothetical protein